VRRRGFTLVELLAGVGVMSLVILGSLSLLISGLQSFRRTDADVRITQQNSQALRKISETLREAMSVTITNNGKTIMYSLPAKTAAVDAVTGERELVVPIQSDGVARGYAVDTVAGVVRELPSNRVIVRNVAPTDPEAGSAQFGQAYTPFQLTSIGSYRAVSINLITRDTVSSQTRWMRMKTTALVRNSQ
jgi:Tfp pilus assembly protein PilW